MPDPNDPQFITPQQAAEMLSQTSDRRLQRGRAAEYAQQMREDFLSGTESEEAPEPSRFAWVRDGRMIAGTLADWVKGWERDYYANEQTQTDVLLAWGGNLHDVPVFWQIYITKGAMTEDDMIPYEFDLVGLPDKVMLSIDGRA